MKKKSQSILNLTNILPMNILPIQAMSFDRSPLENKEAKALYEIWASKKGAKLENAYPIPGNIDPTIVSSLTTKGFIKNKISSNPFSQAVEFTSKAKNIIKNIILYSEKSSFEKISSFDYELIHRSIYNPISGKSKIASVLNKRNPQNWLERSLWK